MEPDEKWYFTKEQLANTPSRKSGYDADKELSCRQQAANFIQDMGQRLQVTQLCINTAIVYMHRFYVFHSFTRFHRNAMAAAALFLAAKVEEQPRKLEHVIKVAQMCLHRELPALDTKSDLYLEQAHDLVMNENVLLQTLGFDVAIDHPHTHVVRCCHLVKASKDLAQTSYFMASNSLHLTTMCLQYKPTVVACFCIHLACKWSNWEIPFSNEGKSWFWYVDRSVTQELLEQLTEEFLRIFDKCPSRLKRKISANQNMSGYHLNVDMKQPNRLTSSPGGSGVDNQHGVSFQQPNRGPGPAPRTSSDDQRNRNDNSMSMMQHVRQVGGGGLMSAPAPPPVDFKKQPLPPSQAHGSRESSYGGFHGMPSSSQMPGTSHQSNSSQFMYPPPSTSFTSGMSANGPNIRLPRPSAPAPKHVAQGTEAIFHPPKRSGASSTATSSGYSSHAAPSSSFTRPAKTEMHPPSQQPLLRLPRNGPDLPQQKNDYMKHPLMDKHGLQKGHKNYDSRSLVEGGWASSDMSGRSNIAGIARGDPLASFKHDKTENSDIGRSNIAGIVRDRKPEHDISRSIGGMNRGDPSSYHLQMPAPVSVKQSMSPPPPPPPLPPPPLPPPPPPPSSHPISKPSSIFSPDKMTPPMPNSPKEQKPIVVSPLLLSPISTNKSGRNRTSSSSSEPELIPVMPKLEEMSGFESLAKGKTAIKLPGKVADPTQRKNLPKEPSKEAKTQDIPSSHRPPDVVEKKPAVENIEVVDLTGKREHKKKKKHKEHREHKDKDRDKEKEKEKKKDKHKDKHREKEKHRGDPAPIKITIPKDKLSKIMIPPLQFPTSSVTQSSESGSSLKIKIPKDKIMKPHVEQGKHQSSLKIKISKDAISSHSSSKTTSSSSSKKRERSSHKDEKSHPSKHAKISKTGDY